MTSILLSVLFILLIFSIRLLYKSSQRTALVVKKYEELSRQFQDQIYGIDTITGLVSDIQQTALDYLGKESKPVVFKMIIDAGCQIAKCPIGSLMILNESNNELPIVAERGLPEKMVMSTHLKFGEGIAGKVAEIGKEIVVENIASDPRFLKIDGIEYRSNSMVSLPLKIKNNAIGILNIHSEEPNHNFDDRTLRLLKIFSDQCAMILENLDLYESLQSFYVEMIETLAKTLELKENVSRNNSAYNQVRIFAREIARELNLPESISKHIEFASLTYGIGKIGIDEAILRKPGKLTPEEYEKIKKHPEIGQKMIANVKFLNPVTHMILYHQERWDGKGYPAGLKGEEIPLGSRIVSVINAYSAMTTDRPYRKALSAKEATEELKKGSGTQFDPKVVEAFVRVLSKEDQKTHLTRNS